jgi:hypothetical protein
MQAQTQLCAEAPKARTNHLLLRNYLRFHQGKLSFLLLLLHVRRRRKDTEDTVQQADAAQVWHSWITKQCSTRKPPTRRVLELPERATEAGRVRKPRMIHCAVTPE